MGNSVLLTQEGFERLKQELEELKTAGRRKVAEAIKEAKSHGDLKENAAYHEAKLNQERLEGRIADLEKILQIGRIIERPDDAHDCAHLGSKVTLRDEECGDTLTVELVGSFEADPDHDKISLTSPLGEALVGRIAGDTVEVETPEGLSRYTIQRLD
ncbi:MAG: transcription elongation factor GreA [Armatimonadetes bacterium]|nr:transcription elongation factor GreA [Armatimonadota bacterium]NOG39101.1 transcription elongation factor GreA [Armatimonadota bacterium]GIK32213.1 MAG: transcription elongation factor GreA [Armatimonadota bacterium]